MYFLRLSIRKTRVFWEGNVLGFEIMKFFGHRASYFFIVR